MSERRCLSLKGGRRGAGPVARMVMGEGVEGGRGGSK